MQAVISRPVSFVRFGLFAGIAALLLAGMMAVSVPGASATTVDEPTGVVAPEERDINDQLGALIAETNHVTWSRMLFLEQNVILGVSSSSAPEVFDTDLPWGEDPTAY